MPNQYLLNSHKKMCTKNKENLQKCGICDKEFNSSQQLFQHYRKCGKFLCLQCDYLFISVKALNSHIQRSHRTQEARTPEFTSVPYVNLFVKTGKSCTFIVCLNMVEMT